MKDKELIVGLDTSDDAAVYKINDDLALIETLDFFTPVVDDPYTFGQIAATNSLSDIYAMGGEPKLALNIVCFPDCLSPDILGEILRGGSDKVLEAGAILVGGHSVSDDEPKYGLSVTGFVAPDKVLVNSNAKVGDILILTKPIGLGVINTAIKAELVSEDIYKEAVRTMTTLNKFGKEAIDKVHGVHSATDITGFGLLGHALEMAEGSSVSIKIHSKDVPIIDGANDYANMGLVPAGAYSNRNHIGNRVVFKRQIPKYLEDLLFDPQTSGGLLISIDKENANNLMEELKKSPLKCAIIGEVLKKGDHSLVIE
mgnify:FL=1|jgi:selenide,water dikinase